MFYTRFACADTYLTLCSEEEQLYVCKVYCLTQSGLSTTDQGQQYQEFHCGSRERVKTLIDVRSCLHEYIESSHLPLAFTLHCNVTATPPLIPTRCSIRLFIILSLRVISGPYVFNTSEVSRPANVEATHCYFPAFIVQHSLACCQRHFDNHHHSFRYSASLPDVSFLSLRSRPAQFLNILHDNVHHVDDISSLCPSTPPTRRRKRSLYADIFNIFSGFSHPYSLPIIGRTTYSPSNIKTTCFS